MTTPPIQQDTLADLTSYERVRFNALKHGILSRYTVLSHENHVDYESLVTSLMDELLHRAQANGARCRTAGRKAVNAGS